MLCINRRRFLAGGLATSLSFGPARAADYPTRPIRVIIPYTAGGVAETIVRLLAVDMEKKLGQRLVVEAKPGAAGNIGTIEVARSEPDGYTILVAATNNYVINQFLVPMPIDPLTDLTPVAKLADVPLVLFSNPEVPANNFKEFVAYARANAGKLNYGTPSRGTVNHLLIERIKLAAGIDIVNVPYRGSPQAVAALLANDIQLFPIGLAAGLGILQQGKLKALAVATEKRLPTLPDVPTLIESGFPGFVATNWWGMSVRAGTPESIVRMIDDAVRVGLANAALQERFKKLQMVIPNENRQQFGSSLKPESELWRQTITQAKINL